MVGLMRVTIVGGGILGTAHALEAIGRGHEVVQLERDAEARGEPPTSWRRRCVPANCGRNSAPRSLASVFARPDR